MITICIILPPELERLANVRRLADVAGIEIHTIPYMDPPEVRQARRRGHHPPLSRPARVTVQYERRHRDHAPGTGHTPLPAWAQELPLSARR